ncbi:transcriptional regulator [Bordetella pertussis]|nr:transcriptional regulator [Bordetella pertussis]
MILGGAPGHEYDLHYIPAPLRRRHHSQAMSQAANPTALPAWDPPAILAQLRANTCFGHMAEPTLAAFAAIAQWRRLDHGELLAGRGTPAPGVVIILKGAIHTSSFSDDGHEFALSMLEFDGLWGVAAVLDGGGMLRDSRAYQQTDILLLPRAAFLDILDGDPGLYRYFVKLLCSRIRTAHAIIDELALRSLPQRLPRLLGALTAGRPRRRRTRHRRGADPGRPGHPAGRVAPCGQPRTQAIGEPGPGRTGLRGNLGAGPGTPQTALARTRRPTLNQAAAARPSMTHAHKCIRVHFQGCFPLKQIRHGTGGQAGQRHAGKPSSHSIDL